MQRPAAASTRNRRRRRARRRRRSRPMTVRPPRAGGPRPPRRRASASAMAAAQGARAWRGEAPQVHRHQGVAVELARLEPVVGHEAVVAVRRAPGAARRCRSAGRRASTWHTPRVTGASPTTALRSRKPTSVLAGSAPRPGARPGAPGRPRRRGRRRWPRRSGALGAGGRLGGQHGVDRAERALLEGEADVDRGGPAVLDVVADGRSGGRADDQDDGRRSRPPGRRWPAGRSPPRPPARPGPGACSRRSAGPARRPGRPGPARRRGRVHPPQRRTALAQVIPPPKPVSSRWSPGADPPGARGRRRGPGGSRPTRCCRSGR